MEDLLSILGNPARLWVVQYLAANGPTRQVDLQKAFASAKPQSGTVNPGVISQLLKPMLQIGLIARAGSSRSALYLPYEEQTRRLLSTASALKLAMTGDLHAEARHDHDSLMRDFTKAVPADNSQQELDSGA